MPVNLVDIRSFTRNHFRGKLADGDLSKRIRDLDIDSLDLLEFVMALEERIEKEIDADEIDQDMTLEQFCQLVERQG
jgi:acyl carrier protein